MHHGLWIYNTHHEKKEKHKYSDCLLNRLEKNPEVLPLPKRINKQWLIEVLEGFDRTFKSEDWNVLKQEFVKDYLQQALPVWLKSRNWTKRNLAARTLVLSPSKNQEDEIVQLVQDPIFLVSSLAARAAITIDSQKGVDCILKIISKQSGYPYFFYLDLLGSGSSAILNYLVEQTAKEAPWHKSCLAIFVIKTPPKPLACLKQDLYSLDLQVRQTALKIVIKNPSLEAFSALLHAMVDKDENVRQLAAEGLADYPSEQTLSCLQKALDDASPAVSLASAMSLKKLGHEGDILNQMIKGYVNSFG